MTGEAFSEKISKAWVAAFGRRPDAVFVYGEEIRVEGLAIYPLDGERWGVGMVVSIPPEAPGEPAEDTVIPQAELNTREEAFFHLLTVASVADEARRQLEGRRSRWDELLRPF